MLLAVVVVVVAAAAAAAVIGWASVAAVAVAFTVAFTEITAGAAAVAATAAAAARGAVCFTRGLYEVGHEGSATAPSWHWGARHIAVGLGSNYACLVLAISPPCVVSSTEGMRAVVPTLFAAAATALPNGVGSLPEMGINTWYMLHHHLVNYQWASPPGYCASCDLLGEWCIAQSPCVLRSRRSW